MKHFISNCPRVIRITWHRQTLKECERDHILRALQETAWRIRGPGGASEILDIKPTTLEARMSKLGIKRPSKKSKIS